MKWVTFPSDFSDDFAYYSNNSIVKYGDNSIYLENSDWKHLRQFSFDALYVFVYYSFW